ncbi:MAG: GTPase Era [Clostridia bacterium]|nr:GTPase Era [Clostridia bacterium]
MILIDGLQDEKIIKDLERVYNEVCRVLSLPKDVVVNLMFVDEQTIRTLNRDTRNIDKVTDVLSYPYTDLKVGEILDINDYSESIDVSDNTLTIGDIYICTKRAEDQAKEYEHSVKREMCFLLCHGLLHICGYDHVESEDAKIMEDMQKKILDNLGISRDLEFRAGFVTIIGDTNAGKSTLINSLVGEHVAIVSPKTQTTRENLIGVYNDDFTQIVFVDTPGYHKRANKIDDEMDKQIATAQEDTEIILMMIDGKRPLVEQYNSLSKKVNKDAKKILLINKIDELKYEKLYPQLAELNNIAKVDEILPISAKVGKNLDVLLDMIKKYLPIFDHEIRYYDREEYTDKNLRHMVAEIVREKALLFLDDEVPHGIQVVVTDYQESTDPVNIYADVYCEKESHKAIILGKNGDMIKKISTKARESIEWLIGQRVNLQLFVKVKENWRNDIKAIADFGLKISE